MDGALHGTIGKLNGSLSFGICRKPDGRAEREAREPDGKAIGLHSVFKTDPGGCVNPQSAPLVGYAVLLGRHGMLRTARTLAVFPLTFCSEAMSPPLKLTYQA